MVKLPEKPKELEKSQKPIYLATAVVNGKSIDTPVRIVAESYYQSLLEYIEKLEKAIRDSE